MFHALGVFLASAAAAATPAAPGWTALAPGAEHLRVDEGAIDLFRFDLETFRADVVVPGAAKPATAAALRGQTGAALVVNGGFFDTEGRPLGLRIADGRQLIGLRKVVDWGVLVLRPGRAAIVHSRDYRRRRRRPPSPAPSRWARVSSSTGAFPGSSRRRRAAPPSRSTTADGS